MLRVCYNIDTERLFRTTMTYDSDAWTTARRAALARDNRQCQDCGCKDDLHVHHIRPVNSFKHSVDAHYVDNLVVLCKYCHPKWEGRDDRPELADDRLKLGIEDVVTNLTTATILPIAIQEESESVYFGEFKHGHGHCSWCHRELGRVGDSYLCQMQRYLDRVSYSLMVGMDFSSRSHARELRYEQSEACECGHVVGDEIEKHRRIHEMVKAATNMASAFERVGVEFGTDVAESVAVNMKQDQTMAGRESDILSTVIETAV